MSTERWTVFYKNISSVFSVAIIMAACTVIAGRIFGIESLTNFIPGYATMEAGTALALLLAGLTLLLRDERAPQWSRRTARRIFPAAIIFVALAAFGAGAPSISVDFSGLMPPVTAVGVLLAGLGLVFLDTNHPYVRLTIQSFALVTIFIAWLQITSYVYSVESLYAVPLFGSIVLPTALAFLLLSFAILFVYPEQGLMKLAISDRLGGMILRRLLPAMMIVPLLIGWARLLGEQAGLYPFEFGLGLFTVSNTFIMAFFVYWVAHILDRIDSERQRTQSTLQKNEERLNLALRSASVGTWNWDMPDGYISWDEHMHPLFGLQPGAFPGSYAAFLELVHPDERERVDAEVNAAVVNGGYNTEFRIVWPNGDIRVIFACGEVHRDASGQPVRMTGICLDLTQRRRMEEQIRQLNADLERRIVERTAQLEASNKELESFAYSVSHDLRAPLRAIDGFARILEEDYGQCLDQGGKRMLGVISENAKKMGALIDDLLALSRLSRARMNDSDVDMAALVREVFKELQQGGETPSPLRFSIENLPVIRCDRALIHQVWINLLTNALKFSGHRKNPTIEVRGYTDTTVAENVYYVKDNGAGFDMRYYDKLFGVFQRLHRNEEFPGIGVGLAIVQRIVMRHKGRVWAEGAPDAGATFYFALPTH